MALIQKSRRALRLYSTAGGSSYNRVEGTLGELPSVQVAEWREVNGLLLRKLTEAAEAANTKKIIYDVFALRSEFQTLWRTTEAELVQAQRDLIACAESGDQTEQGCAPSGRAYRGERYRSLDPGASRRPGYQGSSREG